MEGSVRGRRKGRDDDFWMPDDKCSKCLLCEAAFTLWRRRHHCRVCGRIFCGDCSSHVISGLSAPAAAAAAAAAPAAAAAAAPTTASAPASACLTVSLHAISGLALGNDRPDPVRVCDGCFKAKNPEQLPQATVPVPITGGQAAEQEQPEPEAEGGREGQGGLLAPQRIAVPSGPVFGVSAGQHTEEAEEGEEEENSGGLEAVEVPLPLAATEAHAGARQESMRRLTEAAQSRCVWGGVGGWGVGGAVSPLRVISS